MIMVCSGLGVLVYVIAFFCYFVMLAIVGEGYMMSKTWPLAVVFFLASALVTALGLYLRKQPSEVTIHKLTGREVKVKSKHTVFLIPVIYWGPIFFIFGLFHLFLGLLTR